jgi:hypothetical protein
MTKENIQCSLAGLGRMTTLQAQGRRRFDGVTGSGRRELREDDGAADPGMARVIGVMGSGMTWGTQRRRLREDNVIAGLGTAAQAWGRGLRCRRCHWLGSGKLAARKGLDRGRERW